MAKKQQSGTVSLIPESTVIEVIRTKGDEVVKKEMTYGEWMNYREKMLPGYTYSAFQKGFSQYKLK